MQREGQCLGEYGQSITSLCTLLTMDWREAEAQIILPPKHEICLWLLSAFFAMKFKCEPFDLPNIHTLHTRGVLNPGLRHWTRCPGLLVLKSSVSNLLCRGKAAGHSTAFHSQTVLVEDMCSHSSAWLSSTRGVIISSVGPAFPPLCASSFRGGHRWESLAKVMFNAQRGGLWQWPSFLTMAKYVFRRK